MWCFLSIHSSSVALCSCRVRYSERCSVGASLRRQSTDGYSERNETHEVNAELPHVFLKHKNEKTRLEEKKNGKRDVEKRLDSCTEREGWTEDGEGVEAVVVGVRGGLQAERHVNGERRASLTRSLTRHFLLTEQLLLCVFSTTEDPPPTSCRPCFSFFLLFLFCFFVVG